MSPEALEFDDVLTAELKYIAARRASLDKKQGKRPPGNLFGIALSGGGIRSATINLGFLEVLNRFGLLKKADYLSTVSGGGYTGGYIQGKLHADPDFAKLFSEEDLKYLCDHGDYLTPGRHIMRFINKLRLSGAFVASLLMNWVWIILTGVVILSLLGLIGEFGYVVALTAFIPWVLYGAVIILTVHYFFHYLRYFHLWSSDVLNYAEGVVLLLIAVMCGLRYAAGLRFDCFTTLEAFCVSAIALGITGFFGNPNILTMHRFYRDRLASAFLEAGAKESGKLFLHELWGTSSSQGPHCAPYPLFNTCLNLLSRDDLKFAGVKMSDYFLLSPGFVGSQATGYLPTDTRLFRRMTMSTAVAVSGAALNPNMGTKTNRILTFFMAVLNLQLGYWSFNPAHIPVLNIPFTWWPYYHLLQLLCKTDSTRGRINLSDGGHIENLGVFELLKRRCALIIAIDAGEDPRYEFPDLRNLVIRARNELGITVSFRPGHLPETRIRPSPSSGFSQAPFAIADLGELGRRRGKGDGYQGLLVYVKSSLMAPRVFRDVKKNDSDYWSVTYKKYHPGFPHESTADQFFDSDQWEAYYTLGRYMAGELLGVDLRNQTATDNGVKKFKEKRIDDLRSLFSGRR
jgi:hypothetical protein